MSDEYYYNPEMDKLEIVNGLFQDHLNKLIGKNEIITSELIKEKTARNNNGLYQGYSRVEKRIYGETYVMFLELKETETGVSHHYILSVPEEPIELIKDNNLELFDERLSKIESDIYETSTFLDRILLHITGYVNIDQSLVDDRLSKILD